MRGNLSGYGLVWYFSNGIAIILSLSHVKEKFRVTYDSALDNTVYVHKPKKTTLHIRCNAGVKTTNMRGNLSGYGPVWYFPNGIANILSLSHVKEKFRVTYDIALDNTFYVH